MGIIYCATNKINGKKYIGKSKQSLEKRKQRHFQKSKLKDKKNIYFRNAIRKYGINGFSWEIIEECEEENLNQKEIIYIFQYHTYINDPKCNGYNMTTGGEGGNTNYSGVYSKERNTKISEALKNKPKSLMHKIKLREANLGKHPTEDTKKKMSNKKKGSLHPMYGKHPSEETKIKMGNNKKIPVLCRETNIIYNSITEAEKNTEAPRESITRCCKGKQKTSGAIIGLIV